MPKIGIFFAPSNERSKLVAKAMAEGLRACGVEFKLCPSTQVRQADKFEIAIFYGFAQGLRRIFDRMRRRDKALYIDLGYWGRRKRTRWDGFHKISLNDRHPTAYFQSRPHGPERFQRLGIEIEPWRRSGRHIIVAGMSAKAAAAEGFQPHCWERDTIARLRELTDRPIIYRPKPNWLEAKPIPGSIYGHGEDLAVALRNCHAVVSHHSNVAVDALMAGVPCICPFGVASVLSGHRLEQIEDPPIIPGRKQWAYDLAWTQWSMDEMRRGAAWRYLVDEGLV